jgi:hypothetical protein
LCLTLPAPFLVLPLTALASLLAFLPRPMTDSLVSCGTSAATYGPRSRPSCRRRGAPVTPCSTPDEAQTFQISRRELFSHLRRRASARLAPDPEGRARQRQAAIDRKQRWSPNRRSPARAKMARPIQQNAPIWASLLVACRRVAKIQIGDCRASRNSKVTTQRDEGAGLTVLPGRGAGRLQRPPAVDGSGLPS